MNENEVHQSAFEVYIVQQLVWSFVNNLQYIVAKKHTVQRRKPKCAASNSFCLANIRIGKKIKYFPLKNSRTEQTAYHGNDDDYYYYCYLMFEVLFTGCRV